LPICLELSRPGSRISCPYYAVNGVLRMDQELQRLPLRLHERPVEPQECRRNELAERFQHGARRDVHLPRGGADQRDHVGIRIVLDRKVDALTEPGVGQDVLPAVATQVGVDELPELREDDSMHVRVLRLVRHDGRAVSAGAKDSEGSLRRIAEGVRYEGVLSYLGEGELEHGAATRRDVP